jgi:hypothetical protein
VAPSSASLTRSGATHGGGDRDAILAAKGVQNATAKQRAGIKAGVRSSLENHAGKNVERVGDGVPRRWKIM